MERADFWRKTKYITGKKTVLIFTVWINNWREYEDK